MGYVAHSNGACTGTEYGSSQCTQFAKDFIADVLHLEHYWDAGWGDGSTALGSAEDADYLGVRADTNVARGWVYPIELDNLVSDIGTDDWETVNLATRPRETDVLLFRWWRLRSNEDGGTYWKESTGHTVLARDNIVRISDSEMEIPIFEENVANAGMCSGRSLSATRDGQGRWVVESGFADRENSRWEYVGIIRHNLAGIFSDGWHDDGLSRAFRDAYQRMRTGVRHEGKLLGWGHDNGGGPFVHEVHGVRLQDFYNPDPETRYGDDGLTLLAFDPASRGAYLVRGAFAGIYKCLPSSDGGAMGGAEYLGAPLSEESVAIIDDECNNVGSEIPGETMLVESFQRFERGCMYIRSSLTGYQVKVHLTEGDEGMLDTDYVARECGISVETNPPSVDCVDECAPGLRECAGYGAMHICGNSDGDVCYEWLTMHCADGGECIEGECVVGSALSSFCGDGTCDSGESYMTCPEDCDDPAYCGDGTCDTYESPATCPADCSTASDQCVQSSRRCADLRHRSLCVRDYEIGATVWEIWPCDVDEECLDGRCVEVEVPEPYCGDGTCDSGETCSICVSDCGDCPEPEPCCGDGTCDADEGCESCPSDCGACPEPESTHTIRCTATASGLELEIFGPVNDLLIGGATAATPIGIYVGGNGCGGWSVPYGDSDVRPAADWLGDAEVHELLVPSCITGFNLVVVDESGGLHWFDVETAMTPETWEVTGDCTVEGTLIVPL